MKKYTTKMLDVDAIKFDGSHAKIEEIKAAFGKSASIDSRYDYGRSRFKLIILDRMTGRYFDVNEGDYVVRGALGEIFAYRENLFLEMFNSAEVELEVDDD